MEAGYEDDIRNAAKALKSATLNEPDITLAPVLFSLVQDCFDSSKPDEMKYAEQTKQQRGKSRPLHERSQCEGEIMNLRIHLRYAQNDRGVHEIPVPIRRRSYSFNLRKVLNI